MQVTIQVSDRQSASFMLQAENYVSFIEAFWDWANGPGGENVPKLVKEKFIDLMQVHHVSMG